MVIILNGEKKQVPDGVTIIGLLDYLKIRPERVAVELNMDIVKKSMYASTPVKNGDSVEVVSFMSGGNGSAVLGVV